VVSLTEKPKQQTSKYPGGHRSKKDHQNTDTGKLAKGKAWLAKVRTSASIYVQKPNVMKAITISNDSKSNVEQEEE
jgi:hypothetical protein